MPVTPYPPIDTDVSDPPNRGQAQAVFSPKMDAMLGSLQPLVDEQNALGAWMETTANQTETWANSASTSATASASSATASANSATAAAASLASAVLSPGTKATSTTSMAIGYGSKAFTLAQTGKSFAVGQFVSIASASDPSNKWMNGAITAFNAGTGAITVNVNMLSGSGTFADWAVSQSSPMVDSLDEVGDMVWLPDGDVLEITASSKTRLKTGRLVSAASYPVAAGINSLKVSGVVGGSFGALPAIQVASNGAGTVVATVGDTYVRVSNDYGQNWSNQTPSGGGGNNIEAVTYNGARFILGQDRVSDYQFFYATNPVVSGSWTTGATVTTSTGTGGTIRGAWNGTVALFVGAGSTGAAVTTTDGAIGTARTLPASLGSSCEISATDSTFVIKGSSTTGYTSTNGSSFTSFTTPSSVPMVIKNGSIYCGRKTGSGLAYTSTDLSIWTENTNLPIKFRGDTCKLSGDGATLILSGSYDASTSAPLCMISTDGGLNWSRRWLSSAPAAGGAFLVSNSRYFVQSVVSVLSNSLYAANINVADYVGVPIEYSSGGQGVGVAGSTSAVGYMRID